MDAHNTLCYELCDWLFSWRNMLKHLKLGSDLGSFHQKRHKMAAGCHFQGSPSDVMLRGWYEPTFLDVWIPTQLEKVGLDEGTWDDALRGMEPPKSGLRPGGNGSISPGNVCKCSYFRHILDITWWYSPHFHGHFDRPNMITNQIESLEWRVTGNPLATVTIDSSAGVVPAVGGTVLHRWQLLLGYCKVPFSAWKVAWDGKVALKLCQESE